MCRGAGLHPDRIGLFGVSLGGYYGVTNRAYESRSRMADWLAARLNF